MPAIRLSDIFNAKINTTQVVGCESFSIEHGRRAVGANNDGFAGEAARDRNRFYAEGVLTCQDIFTFDDLLALWEANDSVPVLAEGKLAGNILQSYRLTMQRAKLAGASLRLSGDGGGYAQSTFNLVNSCAPASDTQDDEVTFLNVASKSITHASGLRGVRLNSAQFTPEGGAAITPLGVMALELIIAAQVDRTAGDSDFGESAETLGYSVSGSLTIQDVAITSLLAMQQRLLAAEFGVLVMPYKQQASASPGTITLSNLQFEGISDVLTARKYHRTTLRFGCFSQNGSTAYTLATGSNRIIAVA